MSKHLKLSASVRDMEQKLENTLVPGIIYGQKKANIPIVLDHKTLSKVFFTNQFHTNIIDIKIDGETVTALLKDWHLHPIKRDVLHLDFLRVSNTSEVQVKVPVEVLGKEECPGIKNDNGVLDQGFTEIEIICQANQIPDNITIDISELELHGSLHFSDLVFPKGVKTTIEIDDEHNPMVVAIHPPTKEEEPEPVVEEILDEDGEVSEGDEATEEQVDKPNTEETNDENNDKQ